MERSKDERVLILMPTAKDNLRIGRMVVEAGLTFEVCANTRDLCRQIGDGAAIALLTEEAILADRLGLLASTIAAQPTWSDIPLIVLAREQAGAERLREFMNATLVERPVRVRSLLSVLRAALRSRRHQYEIRDHLFRHQQAEEALRQADRRKDEFLAMLAHELRNPLAPIRSGLDLMRLGEIEPQLIDLMQGQVEHLVRLVDDLLDVSRIMRGKIERRKEPVELSRVISRALQTARPLLDAHRHQVTQCLPASSVWLEADPVRLTQVFANLLNNAAKYTPPGGQIRVNARNVPEGVVIEVCDNGIGMEQELVPQVFELFAQANRSIDRSQGGLGIGLTVCKNLIEMHGGSIAASSAGSGRGSEFVVRMPVIARPDISSLKERQEPNGQHRRILLVDDNHAITHTLERLFLKFGSHDIRTASNGPAAIKAYDEFQPQIVLLDLGLPVMDGYEVARQLRNRPQSVTTLLVAVTGYGTAEDRRRSKQAGFDVHLVKPPAIDDLERLFKHPRLPSG